MHYIVRDKSVITENFSLELLYEMKNFPVFIGTTMQEAKEDLYADMDWYICKKSGVIQLQNLLPLEVIYSGYHSEAVGGVWEKHHLAFVDFTQKYAKNNILELGGSNGFIAKKYIEKNANTNWTIVEPNPSFLGDDKIKVIKAFFDNKFLDDSIDTIVHSHVIEHIYAPNKFLEDISQFLDNNQFQIFSIPNLKKYLEQKFTNTINFEHTFFLTEELMDYLLSLHHFEIIEKVYFGEHSIFYATKKNSTIKPNRLVNHYVEYKNLYENFIHYYKNEVERLNHLINNFEGKIYLFGAHIFSQFLLYMGLNEEKIELILDNSPNKTGQRLYGSRLHVDLPMSIIQNESQEQIAVILKAGQYQEEIKKQLIALNKQTEIWE